MGIIQLKCKYCQYSNISFLKTVFFFSLFEQHIYLYNAVLVILSAGFLIMTVGGK